MWTPIKKPVLTLVAAQTTASGTNSDTFGPAIRNAGHRGLLVYVPRTADTGTCTMDVFCQGLIPGGSETDDTDWFDVAGPLITQFADGETGTYIGVLYPGITAQDTGTDAIGTTTGKKVQHTSGYLPDIYRLRVRNGGTTVTNTFDAIVGVELP